MCECVIRVLPKAAVYDKKVQEKTLPGDIVDILPDGYPWSGVVLNKSDWRIVVFPGVPATAFQDMQETISGKDGQLLARRARYFDLEKVPDVLAAIMANQRYVLKADEASRLLAARANRRNPKQAMI